jgi:hypothetical protein
MHRESTRRKCQCRNAFPQKCQLRIPQLKRSIVGLGLLLQLGQFGEDTGLAFFSQPVALAADVDRRREVQQPVQDGGGQDSVCLFADVDQDLPPRSGPDRGHRQRLRLNAPLVGQDPSPAADSDLDHRRGRGAVAGTARHSAGQHRRQRRTLRAESVWTEGGDGTIPTCSTGRKGRHARSTTRRWRRYGRGARGAIFAGGASHLNPGDRHATHDNW